MVRDDETVDIDVTTEDPGTGAYNRNGLGDPTYGDHVVFTDAATGSGAKPTARCPGGCSVRVVTP